MLRSISHSATLGEVDAVLGDVLLVLDEFVLHLLDEVAASVAELRQVVDGSHDEVEAVEVVHDAHVERGGDSALFDVAAHMDVLVVALVGELVDEARVAVEGEHDGLVRG